MTLEYVCFSVFSADIRIFRIYILMLVIVKRLSNCQGRGTTAGTCTWGGAAPVAGR